MARYAQLRSHNGPSPSRPGNSQLRLGLCCAFAQEPIHFRRTTARYVTGLKPGERHEFLRQIAADNARALVLAVDRLRRSLARLNQRARARIALENDDRVYTVLDLLPLCREEGIPLVYDVHHHRCNPDGLSVEEATVAAGARRYSPVNHCQVRWAFFRAASTLTR